MKTFLMKINVNACTLENSSHIFFSVSGKLLPGVFKKISTNQIPSPLVNFPVENFHLVNIGQKEGLSKEKQLMKLVGIFLVRIFWVAIFRGEFHGWEFLG